MAEVPASFRHTCPRPSRWRAAGWRRPAAAWTCVCPPWGRWCRCPPSGPGCLVGVAELGRLGAGVDPWVDEVVVAAEALGRRTKRAGTLRWTEHAGLDAAEEVFNRVDAVRAARDVVALRRRLPRPEPTPLEVPEGVLALAWAQRRVVVGGPDVLDLVPAPFPAEWMGH